MHEIVSARLRERWPSARIIHELSLRYSENRLDLGAICADRIIGVEIKSSRDVADRLDAQLAGFAPICARIIVALAPKWRDDAVVKNILGRRRMALETWIVDADAGFIEPLNASYSDSIPHPFELLHLLHVAELKEIASKRRVDARAVHLDLATACFRFMSGREVMEDVCSALRTRLIGARANDAPILATAS